MRKFFLFAIVLAALSVPAVFAEEAEGSGQEAALSDERSPAGSLDGSSDSEVALSDVSASPSAPKSLAGVSEVPDSKRPKAPDPERVAELNNTDPEALEKCADILKFGLEEDITALLDKMTKSKDVRFVNEVYDLFDETESPALKEKILGFFRAVEDPCLEDYAVMVLNDPYDEKNSTVNACFSYIQMAGTRQAVPAVVALLESDNEAYFSGALATLGKIGGADEALYITEYLERDDLTVPQRQSLVRVLGELHAEETYDKLVEYAQDEDENVFVRMYSAEAIGVMGKAEAVDVLVDLYKDDNPNLRQYVIKGISHFGTDDARKILLQGLKDNHYKVRQEAIAAIRENDVREADEYLVYRAENDPVQAVKNDSIAALAKLDTEKGNEYLLSQITGKKVPDAQKARVARALLEEGRGVSEIVSLARETAGDDKRKQLRYALGKEMARYENQAFADVALDYLSSKDNATVGTGLDIWARGRYPNCDDAVSALADKADLSVRNKNQLAIKAARLLGRDLDKQTEQKEREREEAAAGRAGSSPEHGASAAGNEASIGDAK